MEPANGNENREARDNEDGDAANGNGNENGEAQTENENGEDQLGNEVLCIHFTIRKYCNGKRDAEDLPAMEVHKSKWWTCELTRTCQLTEARGSRTQVTITNFVNSSLPVSREVQGAVVEPTQQDETAPTFADFNTATIQMNDIHENSVGSSQSDVPIQLAEQGKNADECPPDIQPESSALCLEETRTSPVLFDLNRHPDSPIAAVAEDDDKKDVNSDRKGKGKMFEEDTYPVSCFESPPLCQFEYGSSSQQPQVSLDNGNLTEGQERVSDQFENAYTPPQLELPPPPQFENGSSSQQPQALICTGNPTEGHETVSPQAMDNFLSCLPHLLSYLKSIDNTSLTNNFGRNQEGDGSGSNNLTVDTIPPKAEEMTRRKKAHLEFDLNQEPDTNSDVREPIAPEEFHLIPEAGTESNRGSPNRLMAGAMEQKKNTRGKAKGTTAPKSGRETAGRKPKGSTSNKRKTDDINPIIPKMVARKKARSKTTAPTESDFNREAGTPSQVRQSTAPMEWRPNQEVGTSSQVRESRGRVLLDLNREPGTEVCTLNRNPADFNPPEEDEDEYEDGEYTMRM